MSFILNRLKQPSTYRGLAVLAGILGYGISPELADAIGITVASALAAIEIFRNEKPQPQGAANDIQRSEPQRIVTPELTDEQRAALNAQ